MKVVAVFALLVAMTTAVDLTMKDCGSSAEVTRAFSDDCKDAVCKLKKGYTYSWFCFVFCNNIFPNFSII